MASFETRSHLIQDKETGGPDVQVQIYVGLGKVSQKLHNIAMFCVRRHVFIVDVMRVRRYDVS